VPNGIPLNTSDQKNKNSHVSPVASEINCETSEIEEGVLQLPVDFNRTASSESDFASLSITTAVSTTVHSLSLAWCILLSKYLTCSEQTTGTLKVLVSKLRRTETKVQSQWHTLSFGTDLSEATVAIDHILQDSRCLKSLPIAEPNLGHRAALTLVSSASGSSFSAKKRDALSLLSDVDLQFSAIDLHLVISSADQGTLSASLVYDRQTFLPATISRFAGHLQRIVEQVTTTLPNSLLDIDLLTQAERSWLGLVAHGSNRPSPALLLVQSFEIYAKNEPNSIALSYRDQKLTYGQTNERANQLAHFLVAKGVCSKRFIIVCLEPGIEIIIALLAIWKAGGVYVPLDPTYPSLRVSAMVNEIEPYLVITQRKTI